MNNKKEIIKTILIIIIILGVILYSFILFKNDTEEFSYSNILVNELEENKDLYTQANIVENKKIKVYVTGEVNKPGVIELNKGDRIEDAINATGGVTKQADLNKVNLAYSLEDGQKIYIPNVNDLEDIEYITKENATGVIEGGSKQTDKININTDNINELTNLPGVGQALAQKIINYRKENGDFKKIEDLKNVSGIGDKKFESLRDYIIIK